MINGAEPLDVEAVAAGEIGLDLLEHVRLVEGIVGKLTERLDSDLLRAELPQADALSVHLAVKHLMGSVRDLHNEAERLLIATLDGQRRVEIDGATIEVRRSWNRKWDHPMVTGAIAAATLQGERIDEVDTVVQAIAGALGSATQWKVGALKDLGIDDEGYCTKELGRETVSVS